MDPFILALASGLLPALTTVGGILLKKFSDASLDKPADALKDWLGRPLDQAKQAEELAGAVSAAIDTTLQELPKGTVERVRLVNKLSSLSPETCQLLAASAVEMAQLDPQRVPKELLAALEMEASQAGLLARFLFHLRKKLLDIEDYQPLVHYADDLESRGHLSGLTELAQQISRDARKAATYLELLVQERHLSADDQQALKEYIESCKTRLSKLRLPLVRKAVGLVEDRLKNIFVSLALRDEAHEAKLRREEGLPGYRRKEEPAAPPPPDRLQDILARNQRFILVGPPGSGKSTLLRRAALAFAEGYAAEDLGWKGGPLLPVFVRLRNFGLFLQENRARFVEPAPGALVAYLEQALREGLDIDLPPDFFVRRLKEGACLVLLDGLDEVSDNRVEVAQHVCACINYYEKNRFGLSSRPKGYEGDVLLQLRSARLAKVDVLPLDPDGIGELIRRLVALVEDDERARSGHAERLARKILENKDLTDIAGTPLFCSALVQVSKFHGELPQRKVDVLAEITNLLLGYWHAGQSEILHPEKLALVDGTGKHYRSTDEAIAGKLGRLSHLAYTMQDILRSDEVAADSAAQILAAYFLEEERAPSPQAAQEWAENFLLNSHERSGLLVESDPGTYTFVHKNFREFLAAVALIDQGDRLVDTALEHLDDDWWEQVILLAGAHEATAKLVRKALVERLLAQAGELKVGSPGWLRRLSLSGQLARDMGGYLPGAQQAAVEGALYQAATSLPVKPASRADLADILDQFWEPPDLYEYLPVPNAQAPQFWIAKYPVTNAQYERFLKSGKFGNPDFWRGFPAFDQRSRPLEKDWGEQGLIWLRGALQDSGVRLGKETILEPRYWRDARFGISRRNAPVVAITWYEANAYCRWLQAGWMDQPEAAWLPGPGGWIARLPTESEWVQAAGGDRPAERYPWQAGERLPGEAEITARANVEESKIGRTSPVYLFPDGCSPSGVCDLAGNAWEWQANYYDKDKDWLALRGGSWRYNLKDARLSARIGDHPLYQWLSNGMRVLLALPS